MTLNVYIMKIIATLYLLMIHLRVKKKIMPSQTLKQL